MLVTGERHFMFIMKALLLATSRGYYYWDSPSELLALSVFRIHNCN
jgi:hypothetical protein